MDKEGLPLRSQYTADGFIETYGREETITIFKHYIQVQKQAFELAKEKVDKTPKDKRTTSDYALVMALGQQVDFWSQTLQCIDPSTLNREFFETLNVTPGK